MEPAAGWCCPHPLPVAVLGTADYGLDGESALLSTQPTDYTLPFLTNPTTHVMKQDALEEHSKPLPSCTTPPFSLQGSKVSADSFPVTLQTSLVILSLYLVPFFQQATTFWHRSAPPYSFNCLLVRTLLNGSALSAEVSHRYKHASEICQQPFRLWQSHQQDRPLESSTCREPWQAFSFQTTRPPTTCSNSQHNPTRNHPHQQSSQNQLLVPALHSSLHTTNSSCCSSQSPARSHRGQPLYRPSCQTRAPADKAVAAGAGAPPLSSSETPCLPSPTLQSCPCSHTCCPVFVPVSAFPSTPCGERSQAHVNCAH